MTLEIEWEWQRLGRFRGLVDGQVVAQVAFVSDGNRADPAWVVYLTGRSRALGGWHPTEFDAMSAAEAVLFRPDDGRLGRSAVDAGQRPGRAPVRCLSWWSGGRPKRWRSISWPRTCPGAGSTRWASQGRLTAWRWLVGSTVTYSSAPRGCTTSGYSSQLVDTGFHPIDGARHLRGLGADERLVNLVAHHSCARIEAGLRGVDALLKQEFPPDESLPHDELCFCDQTTGPDGGVLDVTERLAEIRTRYEDGHVVRQFVDVAEPELVATVRRIEAAYPLQPR